MNSRPYHIAGDAVGVPCQPLRTRVFISASISCMVSFDAERKASRMSFVFGHKAKQKRNPDFGTEKREIINPPVLLRLVAKPSSLPAIPGDSRFSHSISNDFFCQPRHPVRAEQRALTAPQSQLIPGLRSGNLISA